MKNIESSKDLFRGKSELLDVNTLGEPREDTGSQEKQSKEIL